MNIYSINLNETCQTKTSDLKEGFYLLVFNNIDNKASYYYIKMRSITK